MPDSGADNGRTCKLVLTGVGIAAAGLFLGGMLVAEYSTGFGLLLAAHSVAVILFLTANAKRECAAAATTRSA